MITDLTYLKSMSNDDSNFISEMVDIFKKQIKEYSIDMPELLAKSDYENLSKMAHKAKSSVAIMGMVKEAELLKSLELNAKDEIEIDSYAEIIDTFIKNSAKAITELEEQLKK